jgi:hypothetical protein
MAAAVRVRAVKMARAADYFKLKYSSLKISTGDMCPLRRN